MWLTKALLEADVEYKVKMVEELNTLKWVLYKLPYSIKELIRDYPIDERIYQGQFLEILKIVVEHESSLQVQEELKWIKALIDCIMNINNLSPREEFDKLFTLLSWWVNPDDAKRNEEGMLFLPLDAREHSKLTRKRITELVWPNGWYNHILDDEYAWFWVRRPN